MAISKMLDKAESKFDNIELELVVTNIMTHEESGKVTLILHSEDVGANYRRSYNLDDAKGVADFKRFMYDLGIGRKNYDKALQKLLSDKIKLRAVVSSQGFVKFFKKPDESIRNYISKSLFIDTIEGVHRWSEEDKKFLLSLTMKELLEEFGRK